MISLPLAGFAISRSFSPAYCASYFRAAQCLQQRGRHLMSARAYGQYSVFARFTGTNAMDATTQSTEMPRGPPQRSGSGG